MVENVIIVVVLALIVGLASFYIYKAKKSGKKCIGCPDSKTCTGSCSGGCGGACSHCGKTEETSEEND
ncbi:MAG: FeoB-associated Cys-rich membrane protein [Clostridia bacterium]|nr:FeoB-associated Cys-rich membrane protein [Clostridia bacterium]